MQKIAINLLPEEFISSRVKEMKFYKIQTFGVAVTLFFVFLSSLTVTFRILQNQRITKAQEQLDNTEQKVLSFKDRQVALLALKNRLTAINQYIGTSSPQAELFNLVSNIIPQSVSVSSLSIDRSGKIIISAVVPDSSSLDMVITDLLDKNKNKSKITQVSVESLSRGKDGAFRVNLNIKTK